MEMDRFLFRGLYSFKGETAGLKKMNKVGRLLALLLLAGIAVQPAYALTDENREMLSDLARHDSELSAAYQAAGPDEYVNLYDRSDRDEEHVFSLPLYFGGTEKERTLRVLVRTAKGANLSARSDNDRVALRLRRAGGGEYEDYFLMTLTADKTYESEADESFHVTLRDGRETLYLTGTLAYRRENLLTDGLTYNAAYGTLFKFRTPVEQEAVVRYPSGVQLRFLGDYGEDSVDLAMRTSFFAKAQGLPEGDVVVYHFAENPFFQEEVEVCLPGGDEVYRIANGQAYPVRTAVSRDGALRFDTDSLGTYAVLHK